MIDVVGGLDLVVEGVVNDLADIVRSLSASCGRVDSHDGRVENVVGIIWLLVILEERYSNSSEKIEETSECAELNGKLLSQVSGLAVGEEISCCDGEIGGVVQGSDQVGSVQGLN